ncbi:uncharacterized protein EAF01_006128 [Botrytis porri]|uniref:uncharacterized protein n=1 Tax=Botrytis porri TaxID=87229 RepID=UPI0019011882|nr:uncharacterized protein EAF01_006128 [Botrytis porri]KAF7905607.1 hypothetical protein EAF01_006128 [Botrytis porri]
MKDTSLLRRELRGGEISSVSCRSVPCYALSPNGPPSLQSVGDRYSLDWNVAHDYHCFDSLRQYVMCNPDYTLWYVSGHRVNSYMQEKTCQDWDALRDWTEEHTSNYYDQYDMEPGTIGDNLWYNYHAGDGLPVGSL